MLPLSCFFFFFFGDSLMMMLLTVRHYFGQKPVFDYMEPHISTMTIEIS